SGVEAEQAVPLATVQALLWPLRADLGELAAGQSALLRGVLALGPQDPTSPFALGAAVLSLLSVASGSRPVVAILDDVPRADPASQEVLTFARRPLAPGPVHP